MQQHLQRTALAVPALTGMLPAVCAFACYALPDTLWQGIHHKGTVVVTLVHLDSQLH
jgi:hypothetical protein